MTADKTGQAGRPIALEERGVSADARLFSPSSARNREPILEVLRSVLPDGAKVLEIASGTGEHAVHFASALPVTWHPSDPDAASRASIASWIAHAGLETVEPPVDLDARAADWSVAERAPFDAVVSINMIHIAPWAACEGLLRGASGLLRPGGAVFLYGPFSRGGVHTAPSNAAFDDSLKARDPAWGVRDLDAVEAAAGARGLSLDRIVEMPANNLSVVLLKD